jgi:hypothetical protein
MGRAPAAQAHMPAERAQASPASAAGANLKTKIAQGIARARRFAAPAGAGRSGMDGAMEGLTPRPRAALARGLCLGRGFLPPGRTWARPGRSWGLCARPECAIAARLVEAVEARPRPASPPGGPSGWTNFYRATYRLRAARGAVIAASSWRWSFFACATGAVVLIPILAWTIKTTKPAGASGAGNPPRQLGEGPHRPGIPGPSQSQSHHRAGADN